jgi:hypothetical protein
MKTILTGCGILLSCGVVYAILEGEWLTAAGFAGLALVAAFLVKGRGDR